MQTDLVLLLVLAAVLLTLYALFARRRDPGQRHGTVRNEGAEGLERDEGSMAEDAVRDIDMDGEFIAKAAGKRTVDAIRFYSQEDCAMLRSMLYSCGIQSLARFGNMNSLRPGAGVPSYNDIVLTLYEDDLDAAREVVEDYNLGQADDAPSPGTRIRNVAEFLVAGWITGGPAAGPRAEFLVPRGKADGKPGLPPKD